jgi:hypothetical protein
MDVAVSEDELRRYLRHANVLLASAPPIEAEAALAERLRVLRLAMHWLRAVSTGLDHLVQHTERQLTRSETLDEPLTAPVRAATMPPRSSES